MCEHSPHGGRKALAHGIGGLNPHPRFGQGGTQFLYLQNYYPLSCLIKCPENEVRGRDGIHGVVLPLKAVKGIVACGTLARLSGTPYCSCVFAGFPSASLCKQWWEACSLVDLWGQDFGAV